ncbi:MAG: type II toxin-antitoxin system PemK/MazF family toxin [Candidatus Moraniibacteriota bacterium]
MEKDFQKWHSKKKEIHESDELPYFYEREIWWCSLGVNIGYEQDGKHENFERPVLLLKKFNQYVLWAVPLTSKQKNGKYYYSFEFGKETSVAILSQLRLISSKRLLRKIGMISEDDYAKIKSLVKSFL